jgi:hypothetical protein
MPPVICFALFRWFSSTQLRAQGIKTSDTALFESLSTNFLINLYFLRIKQNTILFQAGPLSLHQQG